MMCYFHLAMANESPIAGRKEDCKKNWSTNVSDCKGLLFSLIFLEEINVMSKNQILWHS